MMNHFVYLKIRTINIDRRIKPKTIIELKRYKLKMHGRNIPNNIEKFIKRRERNKIKKEKEINKNKRRNMKYNRFFLKEE